ncbi:MAG: triose-phosphate isomerase [Desulforudis sp.]|nr:triose-phosphate isomerase [Clostridia bacterium]MDQ7792073.1 triose-phosphate isomerase [Clostridia bacterium]RJX20568.1 MAG: triose-phosphate isomerase [Desulforudis sp.]
MRTPIIAGNWKMYKTPREAVSFVQELKTAVAGVQDVEILVCPAFPALLPLSVVLADTNIKLGAQNMHWEPEGAYTGEVSAEMLREIGCTYVILGHSERRQYFGETDTKVSKKARSALDDGLVPIICVGETIDERKAGETQTVIQRQVRGCLNGLRAGEVAGLVMAYEPVWAIGTGLTASPGDAQEVNALIRHLIGELYDRATAASVRIQYGGSVKPGNAATLMSQPDIDGALVGGASLKVADFTRIIKATVETLKPWS